MYRVILCKSAQTNCWLVQLIYILNTDEARRTRIGYIQTKFLLIHHIRCFWKEIWLIIRVGMLIGVYFYLVRAATFVLLGQTELTKLSRIARPTQGTTAYS